MIKVLTYGTFDLFHIGHVRLLERLKKLGDHLTVGLSTDEFNKKKSKKSITAWEDRRDILLATKYVDDVIKEETWEQKRTDIIKLDIKIFAMGDDWAGKFDDLKDLTQVMYLPRTLNVSTTDLKGAILKIYQDDALSILNESINLSKNIEHFTKKYHD